MPLIPQQDILTAEVTGPDIETAIKRLKEKMKTYPPVKIVSISMTSGGLSMGYQLVAVIETI